MILLLISLVLGMSADSSSNCGMTDRYRGFPGDFADCWSKPVGGDVATADISGVIVRIRVGDRIYGSNCYTRRPAGSDRPSLPLCFAFNLMFQLVEGWFGTFGQGSLVLAILGGFLELLPGGLDLAFVLE